MTLGYWLEFCASALHPVAMTFRVVETRLLGTVLLSASIHNDEAKKSIHRYFAINFKKTEANLQSVPRQCIIALSALR